MRGQDVRDILSKRHDIFDENLRGDGYPNSYFEGTIKEIRSWCEERIVAKSSIYSQAADKGIQWARQETAKELINAFKVLFWFDDDSKTAGDIVTGSIIYSYFKELESKYLGGEQSDHNDDG